jgi:large subunit ribosomal protein L25
MNEFEIEAETRHVKGKGASRRLRRDGKFPGVVYGAHEDAVSIQLGQNDMLLHTAHEAFYSHILDLKIDGKPEKVVVKDMQRHPYKPFILHMDFQRIDQAEQLSLRVPLHFINEDICVGVKQDGGIVSHLISDLEISCLPKDLPEFIQVDVANVHVGESVHLADLVMPEGVVITSLTHGGDDGLAVAQVVMPRAAQVEDDDEDTAADAPEEAAPSGDDE